MYNPVEIILKKRSGQELTPAEMTFMVSGFIAGEVPEYQMSAFLMAIFFQGMTKSEIVELTRIYIESGSQIKFPEGLQTCDKHSTGGVGDKITMTLAPIVAACGAYIPMISGRGLGHTGGTLDKLESIPGFDTYMTEEYFVASVLERRLAIIAQSKALVPADKKIYALRDVTATVESLPLITASIMSKKIAEGARNLVIDLKVGSGAFMKTMDDARKLAELLKHTGESFGQKVSVIFTQMESPLGFAIGNAMEIKESIGYLKGAHIPDIDQITKALAVEMLMQTGIATSKDEALQKIAEVIENRAALQQFKDLIQLHKGNPAVCDDTSLLPEAKYVLPIKSDKEGYINSIDSQKIGYALIKIGAGRVTLDSPLDMGAGAYLYKKIGDQINLSEEIGQLHTNNIALGQAVVQEINDAMTASSNKPETKPLILGKL